jgi:ribosome biogenesis GTPase A
MAIGWYPGHMTAARRKAAETLAVTDVVIEVLDARLPGASTNPMIAELRAKRQRPCLKVLNKADMADANITNAWMRAFAAEKGVTAVALSCKKPGDAAKVLKLAAGIAPHRDSPLKPLRMLVMGIPNVGKSTLINALLKRKVAATGDEPAITKQQGRYELSDRMVLVDTPGLMWPAIRHPTDGLMLAASHSIGRNAYIDDEVAIYLADLLLKFYPARLAERYKVEPATLDGIGLIEAIARKRGLRSRGGDPDFGKASLVFLQDYRTGALGRISLETPQSRAAMIDAYNVAMAEAEARKAEAAKKKEAAGAGRSTDAEPESPSDATPEFYPFGDDDEPAAEAPRGGPHASKSKKPQAAGTRSPARRDKPPRRPGRTR